MRTIFKNYILWLNLGNWWKKRGDTILDIFCDNDTIPEEFKESVLEFGTRHFQLQKTNIDKTLDLIHNKPNLTKLNNLIETQINCACKWCEKYNVDLNYQSIFFNKIK